MMKSKSRKIYVCTDCGSEASKWQGKCSDCHAWNTFKEINLVKNLSSHSQHLGFSGLKSKVQNLNEVNIEQTPRFSSGIQEFNRVLGGGFVIGSSVLIGGNPGAGKSTILLQVLCYLAETKIALYVSGEESLQQIATRAKRLKLEANKLKMLAETNVEEIIKTAEEEKPEIIVIDSIQVMYTPGIASSPGGITQVKESTTLLTQFAKQTNTVLLLIGHITKDNSLAGPMTLSHIIDTQLMLNTNEDARFRMLRATKNRFGQINELGVFAMTEQGMKEINNPSSIFLSKSTKETSGSIISVIWEGTRPLLVEIQALVVESQINSPRRVTVGIDQNRLTMLLAILYRHGGIFTNDQDVFVNVVGGVKIYETSADLANILAVVSSLKNTPLSRELCVFGELGLSGEIRPVANGQERIIEAVKHGFKKAIIPKLNKPHKNIKGIEIIAVDQLSQALDAL